METGDNPTRPSRTLLPLCLASSFSAPAAQPRNIAAGKGAYEDWERIMTRMFRSAAGMQWAIRRGASSIRGRPVEPTVDSFVETLKDRGVSSVNKEFVHQFAHSIDMARQDKVFSKVTQAGLMAAIVLSGLTFGNTLVSESAKLKMSKRGRKVVEEA